MHRNPVASNDPINTGEKWEYSAHMKYQISNDYIPGRSEQEKNHVKEKANILCLTIVS